MAFEVLRCQTAIFNWIFPWAQVGNRPVAPN
jgi:hypothetical protein